MSGPKVDTIQISQKLAQENADKREFQQALSRLQSLRKRFLRLEKKAVAVGLQSLDGMQSEENWNRKFKRNPRKTLNEMKKESDRLLSEVRKRPGQIEKAEQNLHKRYEEVSRAITEYHAAIERLRNAGGEKASSLNGPDLPEEIRFPSDPKSIQEMGTVEKRIRQAFEHLEGATAKAHEEQAKATLASFLKTDSDFETAEDFLPALNPEMEAQLRLEEWSATLSAWEEDGDVLALDAEIKRLLASSITQVPAGLAERVAETCQSAQKRRESRQKREALLSVLGEMGYELRSNDATTTAQSFVLQNAENPERGVLLQSDLECSTVQFRAARTGPKPGPLSDIAMEQEFCEVYESCRNRLRDEGFELDMRSHRSPGEVPVAEKYSSSSKAPTRRLFRTAPRQRQG